MFDPKIKINKQLYDRVTEMARKAGYSSVDEFVVHMLEKELAKLEGGSDDQVEERLRGLGYIE